MNKQRVNGVGLDWFSRFQNDENIDARGLKDERDAV
jgi:hypothetical protein